jgi:hypothetical protein
VGVLCRISEVLCSASELVARLLLPMSIGLLEGGVGLRVGPKSILDCVGSSGSKILATAATIVTMRKGSSAMSMISGIEAGMLKVLEVEPFTGSFNSLTLSGSSTACIIEAKEVGVVIGAVGTRTVLKTRSVVRYLSWPSQIDNIPHIFVSQ